MSEPQAAGEALLALDQITRRLRRECPWDRAQDERSIVPHTVEEAYELADAAHAGDDEKLLDELGDVLFQVHFLALLLEERGAGDLEQVAVAVTRKLVRRHPHVFEEGAGSLEGLPTNAETASDVRENWDAIKQRERGGGVNGIPRSLPSLLYAGKVQKRLGAPKRDPREALGALRETLERIDRTTGAEDPYESVGALLLAAVTFARSIDVDPEVALRLAAEKLVEEA
jgi:MazG family protein